MLAITMTWNYHKSLQYVTVTMTKQTDCYFANYSPTSIKRPPSGLSKVAA